MMTNPQYSKKETLLFQQLGYEDFLYLEPAVLYRMVALNLFKQNETGVLVDSVRRCLNAIDNGTPYRLIEEFDELIVLIDKQPFEYYLNLIRNGEVLSEIEISNAKELFRLGYNNKDYESCLAVVLRNRCVSVRNKGKSIGWNDWFYNRYPRTPDEEVK